MASNPLESKSLSVSDSKLNDDQSSSDKQPKEFLDSNILLEEVRTIMNCPICLEHLTSPIFMCETGHNICGDCQKQITSKICPMCKATITEKRNFCIEAIAAKTQKAMSPCPNEQFGCTFTGPTNKIDEHSTVCNFRKIKCPLKEIYNCQWTGKIINMEKHFMDFHGKHMLLKPGVDIVIHNFKPTFNDVDLQLISFNNCLFLFHAKIDMNKKIAYWAIQFIGSKNDAARWKYEFTFLHKKAAKFMNFSEKCHSFETNVLTLFNSGNCIGIPLDIINNFIQENGKFAFKFTLRRIQIEMTSPENLHKHQYSNSGPSRSRSKRRIASMYEPFK